MNLYLIIIVIIISIYAYCYYITPESFIILQTTLDNFTFDLLLEKQPIVISDKIVDINQIIETWFKENFIKDINLNDDTNDWIINKNKYLYLQSNDDNVEIIISRNNSNVGIKLKNKQNLIIPFMCKYYIDNNHKNNIDIKGIDDYITYFLAFFF